MCCCNLALCCSMVRSRPSNTCHHQACLHTQYKESRIVQAGGLARSTSKLTDELQQSKFDNGGWTCGSWIKSIDLCQAGWVGGWVGQISPCQCCQHRVQMNAARSQAAACTNSSYALTCDVLLSSQPVRHDSHSTSGSRRRNARVQPCEVESVAVGKRCQVTCTITCLCLPRRCHPHGRAKRRPPMHLEGRKEGKD